MENKTNYQQTIGVDGSVKFLLPIMVFIFMLISSLRAQRDDRDFAVYTYWVGEQKILTIQKLASYCAPIFWFSPDEPLLQNKSGKDIIIPTPFPFEDSLYSKPVVYYQLRNVLALPGQAEKAFISKAKLADSQIDLSRVAAFHIDYLHYYPEESGTGSHKHDTEMVQFKIYVKPDSVAKGKPRYHLFFLQATATAHAVRWYENIYTTDLQEVNLGLQLPFHVFVEEGKHASCTDMNGDGYYTPGFDVNVRTNDAWGIKDVVRTGKVYAPTFESWMAKPRKPPYQVFPPLPEDSPLRKRHTHDGKYAAYYAVYELRPVPRLEQADADPQLRRDMSGYVKPEAPIIKEANNAQKFFEWWETDQLIKSLSIAFRADDNVGLSFAFPLLITKNVEVPMIGGWLVNRIYLQDDDLRDFGYGLLYTPSASRFMDPYICAGLEVDRYEDNVTGEFRKRTDFVFETGVKFRTTVSAPSEAWCILQGDLSDYRREVPVG